MKHLLPLTTLVVAVMWMPIEVLGSDPKDQAPKDLPKTVILRHTKHDSLRPNAPSRVIIECAYGDGVLQLHLPSGVYYANLRLMNDTYVWEGLVTADNPTVEIPSLNGEYTLLCQTDDGRIFTGLLEF